ncbi:MULTISPECIES: transporter substrate-binding domain-containing protein [Roseomonas]|nr:MULTISPECIES: transporter substrate-binding domain-containing protein [Roseomonas]MCG7357433.1 transporter substrate-binding domain-containing protein [Roseomonas mucosa]
MKPGNKAMNGKAGTPRRRCLLALAALGMLPPIASWAAVPPLPVEIAARGTLVIALFASFPPMAYKLPADNRLVGVDVDLAADLAKRLGLRVEWQDTSYESAINAMATGRVDMAFSMLNRPESADRLDYVDYLTSGMQIYTLASHTPIAGPEGLCGLRLGANRRNGFDAAMRAWSDTHCVAQGRPAIQIQATEGTPEARLQLRQSRVDAVVQSSESVPYTMAQEAGTYVMVGEPLNRLTIGMAFVKKSSQLRDAMRWALEQSIADGSYAAILARHDLARNAIASSTTP